MKKIITAVLCVGFICTMSMLSFANGTEGDSVTSETATLQEPFTFKFKNNASLKLYGKADMLTYYGTTSPFVSDWLAFVYPDTVYDGTQGNPWIRLPQLRFTAKNDHWKWEVSANRSMAADEVLGATQDDLISDGEQSSLPLMMSRLGYTGQMGSMKIGVGLSGAYGQEQYYRNSATQNIDKSLGYYIGVFDLFLGSKYIDFKGEAFYGENVNTFYAGVMQGVLEADTDADGINDDVNGVVAMGGWAQFTFKPTSQWSINLGAGIDDPDNNDLAVTGRAYNFMGYTNLNYKPNKWLAFALEPSFMRTGYNNDTYNDNIRGLLRTTFAY